MKTYSTFKEFYPYYLSEHQHPITRKLHFFGTMMVLAFFALLVVTGYWLFFVLIPLFGYGFAWVGHFFFEKNKPATFKHPLYSLMGDFVMFWDILLDRLK